jgi:hypothetical protein
MCRRAAVQRDEDRDLHGASVSRNGTNILLGNQEVELKGVAPSLLSLSREKPTGSYPPLEEEDSTLTAMEAH